MGAKDRGVGQRRNEVASTNAVGAPQLGGQAVVVKVARRGFHYTLGDEVAARVVPRRARLGTRPVALRCAFQRVTAPERTPALVEGGDVVSFPKGTPRAPRCRLPDARAKFGLVEGVGASYVRKQ